MKQRHKRNKKTVSAKSVTCTLQFQWWNLLGFAGLAYLFTDKAIASGAEFAPAIINGLLNASALTIIGVGLILIVCGLFGRTVVLLK